MSSFVSEHIINPVLRQARRFSDVSRIASFAGGGTEPSDANAGAETSSHSHAQAVIDSEHTDNDSTYTAVVTPDSPSSRPVTSSTQETRVEDSMSSPTLPIPVEDAVAHDHLGFPLTPPKNRLLPEDDGMRALRSQIQAVNARHVSPAEKGRLMHGLLLERYNASRVKSSLDVGPQIGPATVSRTPEPPTGPLDSFRFWQNPADLALPETFSLSNDDIAPTFAPIRRPKGSGLNTPNGDAIPVDTQAPLGCQHYERNVKSQCFACNKWYTCRLCHDANEDHKLPFLETRFMLCMLCSTPQRVSDTCINCAEPAAQYYCHICKLWESRQSKPIYHCADCGICRRGFGLGKDYVHCKTCCACIPTSIETSHKCIERSTDCDCPICGDYMFTSPKPVVFMKCGHSIHKKCYEQHMQVSYKCPICNKSLTNMESQFRNLDIAILGQPMPLEFKDTKAIILCNDCSGKSTVPYHWLGLKCSICLSYNTVELQILGGGAQLAAVLAEQTMPSAETLPITLPNEPRPAVTAGNRRRHSSRGIETQRRASEAIVGSYPPIGVRHDASMSEIPSDNESDMGMLGFWGRNNDDESSAHDDESDEEEGSDMSDVEEEEEEEDDEDNEFLLIGHR